MNNGRRIKSREALISGIDGAVNEHKAVGREEIDDGLLQKRLRHGDSLGARRLEEFEIGADAFMAGGVAECGN